MNTELLLKVKAAILEKLSQLPDTAAKPAPRSSPKPSAKPARRKLGAPAAGPSANPERKQNENWNYH